MSFPLLISGYVGKWCKYCIFLEHGDMSCYCKLFGYIKTEKSPDSMFEPVRAYDCLQMEKESKNK